MRRAALALVVAVAAAAALSAIQLKPRTLAAWDRYLALHDAQLAENRANGVPYLWVDRLPEDERAERANELANGEVVTEALEIRDNGKEVNVPDGKIHHWVGTVLVPGATLEEVITFVQDYDRYPERFAPNIQSAEVVFHEGDRWIVRIRSRTKKVITVIFDADYVVDFLPLGPTRLEAMNVVTNIFEVEDAGEASERRVPGDSAEAGGFVWRLRMICRFEEREEGTYEECESVTLTRSVPWMLRVVVNPFVNSVPRETIEFNLGVVRDGVGRGD